MMMGPYFRGLVSNRRSEDWPQRYIGGSTTAHRYKNMVTPKNAVPVMVGARTSRKLFAKEPKRPFLQINRRGAQQETMPATPRSAVRQVMTGRIGSLLLK